MRIKNLYVDGYGILSVADEPRQGDELYKGIFPFQVNGEMAAVTWYRCLDYNLNIVKEVNGKYVSMIEYSEDKQYENI